MAKGITDAAGGPSWWVYVLLILSAVVAAFFGSYLGEKGKNLATKEDIAKVTDKVEGVKRQHEEIIERLKLSHQLQILAGERRLQAHQEAFVLWRKILRADPTHWDECWPIVQESQNWWERNCMYLGPESRDAMFRAYTSLHIQRYQNQNDRLAELFEDRKRPGEVLFKEVALPPLTPSNLEKLAEGGFDQDHQYGVEAR
jgi:hypothetical protein